jgi:hypothetical protein
LSGIFIVMLLLSPVSFLGCLVVNGLLVLLVRNEKRRIALGFLVTPALVALLWGFVFIGPEALSLSTMTGLVALATIAAIVPASFASLWLIEWYRR